MTLDVKLTRKDEGNIDFVIESEKMAGSKILETLQMIKGIGYNLKIKNDQFVTITKGGFLSKKTPIAQGTMGQRNAKLRTELGDEGDKFAYDYGTLLRDKAKFYEDKDEKEYTFSEGGELLEELAKTYGKK